MNDGGNHASLRAGYEGVVVAAQLVAVAMVLATAVLLLGLYHFGEHSWVRLYPLPVPSGTLMAAPVLVIAPVALATIVAALCGFRVTFSRSSPGLRTVFRGRTSDGPPPGTGHADWLLARGTAFTCGGVVASGLLLVLPSRMVFAFVVVVASVLALAGIGFWIVLQGTPLGDGLLGGALTLYAIPATASVQAIESLPELPSGSVPLLIGLSVAAWSPVVVLRLVRTADWRPDPQKVLVLAAVLLVVGAGTVVADREVAEPTTAVDTPSSINVSETQRVLLGGETDNYPLVEVAQVGRLVLSNPAAFAQPVPLPDVRACLFSPWRHDIDVLQGGLESSGYGYGGTIDPAPREYQIESNGTRSVQLWVDLKQFESGERDSLDEVPVTLADTCPEESDRPRLVVYTTSDYDPRGWE